MPSSSEISLVSSAEILDYDFANHKPRSSFDKGTLDEWTIWRKQLLSDLRELLGPFPTQVSPVDAQIISTQAFDKFTLHKVIYYSKPSVPIPAYLLIPKNATDKTPAVVCIHGHVSGGKESVVFGDGAYGVPYGRELAEQGVITLCPDNAGMGERTHPSGGCDFLWRRLNYLT